MNTDPLFITFIGYEIRGVVEVCLWGGAIKALPMRPVMTDNPSRTSLLKLLNSNGEEVEWIKGGICHTYGVWADEWGNKLHRFYRTLTVGKVTKFTRGFEENILG